jgi:predicted nucleic acid-binding protein
MFAASPTKIKLYRETGSCGNRSLDYAIDLLLKLGTGGYSTSEIALLETVGVASCLGGPSKAEMLLRAVIAQEGFRILETTALAYPLSFAFTLVHQIEPRDALHLAVAILGGASILATSDTSFADATESTINYVAEQGFQIPRSVKTIYRLANTEATLIEERVASLSTLSVERAPA